MNAEHIIKCAIPDATDETIHYIMWERTPYPVGKVTPMSIYKAASRFHRAIKNNIRLCDLCDNMLELDDKFTCKRCTNILDKLRNEQTITRQPEQRP